MYFMLLTCLVYMISHSFKVLSDSLAFCNGSKKVELL